MEKEVGFMGSVVREGDAARGNKKDLHDLTFYRFAIDSLPTAVVMVDADFKIIGFNPWAERLTGYGEAEAMGQFCGDILQCGMCRLHCPWRTE